MILSATSRNDCFYNSPFPLLLFVIPASPIRHSRFSYSSFPRRRESRPPRWVPRPPGTSFPFSYSSFPLLLFVIPAQAGIQAASVGTKTSRNVIPLLLFVIPASPIRHSRAGGNPGRLGGYQDLPERHSPSPIRHSRFSYPSFPPPIRHSRAGGNPVKPNLYINPSNVDSYLQSTSASMPASIS